MSARHFYDVVFYWAGGIWREAPPEGGAEATIARLNRLGYVALRGALAIGPPDDGPTVAELEALAAARSSFSGAGR